MGAQAIPRNKLQFSIAFSNAFGLRSDLDGHQVQSVHIYGCLRPDKMGCEIPVHRYAPQERLRNVVISHLAVYKYSSRIRMEGWLTSYPFVQQLG